MNIVSKVTIAGNFRSDFTQDEIKNEIMFFNSSIEYAYENGGAITKAFIDSLPEEFKHGVIDSRVHMLMPNWYPCIPGYHHDDVPRNTPNKQPNYQNPEYNSRHILGLVNAEVAPTNFAIGSAEFPLLTEEVYKHYNKMVVDYLNKGQLFKYTAKSGILYEFDSHSWHTGTGAVKSGWRWFARVSIDTERLNNITNEIRRQVQVYMDSLTEGW